MTPIYQATQLLIDNGGTIFLRKPFLRFHFEYAWNRISNSSVASHTMYLTHRGAACICMQVMIYSNVSRCLQPTTHLLSGVATLDKKKIAVDVDIPQGAILRIPATVSTTGSTLH